MTFEHLSITHFGKLSDISLDLSSGVNIIEGANESGKSTICAFLQFMFYGLSGRAEEKLRYISWQSSRAGGSLTFSEGGTRYRIEREVICITGADHRNSFREKCAIYDLATGQPVLKGQNPGDVFFGVSETVFQNTVCIRQTADTKIGGHALSEEAENILFSGSESINTKKAIEKLESARVFLRYKTRRGGKISELEDEREEVARKLEEAKTASGDIIYLEGTRRQLTEKIADSEKRLQKVDEELATYERYTMKKAYLRRKAEKARLAETEERLAEAHAPADHAGIDIGSDVYISALELRRQKQELASAKYEDAEKALTEANRKLSDMSEKLAIFERFGARSGGKTRSALIEHIREEKQKMHRFHLAAIGSLVTALILAIIAFAMFFVMPDRRAVVYLPAFLAPVALILCAIFFMQKKAPREAIETVCKKFNCKTYEEFEELVRAASEDEAYMLFITTARDDANDKFNAASEQLEKISAEIFSALEKDGFSIADNIAVSLDHALRICRDRQSEITKLETMRSEQCRRIEEIDETLSAYPKEYLRAACLAEYDEEAMEAFQLTARRRDRDFLNGSLAAMKEKLHKTEVDLSALLAVSVHPTELAEEKNALDAKINALTQKWEAYMLAIETLENASGKLREGISPKIAANAGRLMNGLSDGKYDKIGVDLDFGLSFSDGEQMHDAAYLSAGTGDMAYICLRIALIELLYQKAIPPFLFDESFVRMDDARLKRLLALIAKYAGRGFQSILFTCHEREKTLMEEIGECQVLSI